MLLGGGKKKKEGMLSDGVSSRYRLWLDYMILSIRTANPSDCPYSVIHTENLVGLLSCVFVKNSERHRIKDSAIIRIKRGLHGHYGNKVCVVLDSRLLELLRELMARNLSPGCNWCSVHNRRHLSVLH
jgi:Endonuclease/Exonuclease/phosphatase family 2